MPARRHCRIQRGTPRIRSKASPVPERLAESCRHPGGDEQLSRRPKVASKTCQPGHRLARAASHAVLGPVNTSAAHRRRVRSSGISGNMTSSLPKRVKIWRRIKCNRFNPDSHELRFCCIAASMAGRTGQLRDMAEIAVPDKIPAQSLPPRRTGIF